MVLAAYSSMLNRLSQLWNVGRVPEARRVCHVAHFIRPIILGPIGVYGASSFMDT